MNEIKQFLKSDQNVLELDIDRENDILWWPNLRNPLVAFFNFITLKLTKYIPSLHLKNFLLRHLLSMEIGEKTGIAPSNLDSFYPELISIGKNSIIGLDVNILTHEFLTDKVRVGRVKIGDEVVIGAFSTIRSGVEIGDGSIVAMNSFVNKDIPPNELWGGVPAQKIKDLE